MFQFRIKIQRKSPSVRLQFSTHNLGSVSVVKDRELLREHTEIVTTKSIGISLLYVEELQSQPLNTERMGNVKSSMQPLALIAVARQLRLQRIQMVALRDALSTYSDSTGFVDKTSFAASLKQAKIVNPGDVEIFDLLFIMWDGLGTEKIPYKEFSIGVSVLACPHDEVVSILRFALHIQDELNTGMISPKCLRNVLQCKYWQLDFHRLACKEGLKQI